MSAATAAMMFGATAAFAQDIPGIEICTAEKTMERRTGCLQANVNFLKSALTKAELEMQRKLDLAARQLDAANRRVDSLSAEIAELRARLDKLQPPAKDTSKDAPKAAPDAASDAPKR